MNVLTCIINVLTCIINVLTCIINVLTCIINVFMYYECINMCINKTFNGIRTVRIFMVSIRVTEQLIISLYLILS